MKSNLARSLKTSTSIVRDLVDQMHTGDVDLFEVPDSPYHLEENEVSVDLFCGAGGTSEGIRQALLESPAFAVNHNPDAIGVHDINHPETIHLESDVFAANPEDYIPRDKVIGLLSASPSCVHFSTARGGKPLDREIRDQAWVVTNWCEHPNPRFRPRVVVVENVREFLTWAPLTADNKIDKRFIDKDGIGSIFKEWRSRLVAAGYNVEYQILNAADYGVPTKRRRLIIIARRDGLPIRFPTPTHAPRNSPEVLSGELQPYLPASECIDFTIQCNPIFMYPEDAKKAGAIRPLADNTLKRIAAGVERFVIDADEPFIVSYYGPKSGEGFRGQKVSDPLPTQTTENRFAIVNPLVTPLTHSGPGRYYPMDGQLPTLTCARRGELALVSTVCSQSSAITAGAIIPLRRDTPAIALNGLVPALTSNSQIALAIGTLAAPVSGEQESSYDIASAITSPFVAMPEGSCLDADQLRGNHSTQAMNDDDRSTVIIPTLVRVAHGSVDRNGKRRGRGDHDIPEPLPTQSTSNEFALVEPFMVTTGYGERKGQAPRVHSLLDPMNAFVACGAKHAVVEANFTPTIGAVANDNVRAALIVNNNTNRLATPVSDPVTTMTTGNQEIVPETSLRTTSAAADAANDVTDDPCLVGPSLIRPIVAAHMAQHNEGNVGHPITEPVSTMTTKVCHQNLVTSHMLTLRQNGFGQSLHEPTSAFCAAGNHHGEVRTCLVKYYGEGGQWQATDEPLDTLTAKPRFAVVQVPIEELGLTEEQRFEAWWIARFLEEYGTKESGNPRLAYLDGPRPSVVGRPGAVLWTIQMRMLVPKEAFAASSFPEHYQFEKRADGKRLSKSSQMQLVGNAVPPGLARAVVGANLKPRRSILKGLNTPMKAAA